MLGLSRIFCYLATGRMVEINSLKIFIIKSNKLHGKCQRKINLKYQQQNYKQISVDYHKPFSILALVSSRNSNIGLEALGLYKWRSDKNKARKPKTSTKLKSIEDPKFQTVVPNTAKVIYAWDNKMFSISKNLI